MELSTVLSIDPDDVLIQEVAGLAASFGILEIADVLTQLETLKAGSVKQIMFLISDETAADVIATILSLAIINYGTWKHEEIFVHYPSEAEDKPLRFYRQLPADKYKNYGDAYLAQAKVIIEKYFYDDRIV